MAKKTVYELIKRQNGETFAQTIRSFDSGIFDVPNLQRIVKYAGNCSDPLLDFLSMLKNVQIKPYDRVENPFDLLKRAGYNAYLVTNRKELLSIKKYFTKDALLCSFDDPKRTDDYFIIHCVKEGADQLLEGLFYPPRRDDEYATSVISIQIAKRGGLIKITNRYNHLVENPDNTFNSNPDNIIKGLSWALMHYFQIDFSATQVYLPDGYIYRNGQIIEYDYKEDHIYFSSDYFVVGDDVIKINKDYQLIFDRFILDLRQKCILNPFDEIDSLPKTVNALLKNKKLSIDKKNKAEWHLLADNQTVMRVKQNRLVWLNLMSTQMLSPCFLAYSNRVETIIAPNVEHISRNSIRKSMALKNLVFPKLRVMEERCMMTKDCNPIIFMPNLISMGDLCFERLGFSTQKPEQINFPLLNKMGYQCFKGHHVSDVYLPSCTTIGNVFATKGVTQRAYLPVLTNMPTYSGINETVPYLYAPVLIDKNPKKEFLKLQKDIAENQRM